MRFSATELLHPGNQKDMGTCEQLPVYMVNAKVCQKLWIMASITSSIQDNQMGNFREKYQPINV